MLTRPATVLLALLLMIVTAPGGIAARQQRANVPDLPAPPIRADMREAELSAALDAWLTKIAAAGDFAGVVAIARDGRVVYERGFGPADRERGLAAAPDLRFNLGSIGKAFTKVAIAQLIWDGKLKMTDTLGELLPDYPNVQSRPATVAQLLGHTAGIADFFGPDFSDAPKDQFASNADYLRFVAGKPALFAPGTRNQYCNGCYIALGEIVARVSGMPYERYVQERIFAPAGMSGAGFLSYGDDKVAPPYTLRRGDGQAPVSAIGMHGRRGSAAGGSFARAADLIAFDNALRDGRLLEPPMIRWYLNEGEIPSERTARGAAPIPRARGAYGIAGGAPGVNAELEGGETWTIAVVGNLDPPNAARAARAIRLALR